ncbi:TniB family NTP-binding protein [Azospirillum argentinense]
MDTNDRDARLERIGALFAETTQTRRAFARIRDLHRLGRNGHEAKCMLLMGPTGAGKSHTVRRYEALHPMAEGDLGVIRHPVVVVRVPPRCTLRSLAAATLLKLADADPASGSEPELTERVFHHLRAQNVELLIFDEAQHLISKRDDSVAYEAADWLKCLLDENICPLLLEGQTSTARVVTTNPQFRRRMMAVAYLDPFDWRNAEEQLEFRAILDLIDRNLGFPQPSDLGRTATALRIHHHCRGLLGNAMNLIVEASRIALDADRPCVTHEILAEAVDELALAEERTLFNPFRAATVQPALPAPRNDDVEARAADAANRRFARRSGRGA